MGKADDIPLVAMLSTYLGYLMLLIFGYVCEFFFIAKSYFPMKRKTTEEKYLEKGYAKVLRRKQYFFSRRFFARIRDCWDRPICSAPGGYIDILERSGSNLASVMNAELLITGNVRKQCLNLGSYNYLGFAETSGSCIDAVKKSVMQYGIGTCSSRPEAGTHTLHRALEKRFAKYIGKEDCLIFGMGYATNSTTIPSLVGPGSLVISDSLNHASIVIGCRSSGASITVFKHNDPADLERVIRKSLLEGQPKTHRDWKKIIIVVEGIYSMEGEICKLREIVAIKKKYKCYLYVDEAHSIGALGPRARGVTDHCGVDPADVDILMGTFTKSFGSVGGYIASDKSVIDYLRLSSFAAVYSVSMPFGCTQMVLSVLDNIDTKSGKERIDRLKSNSNYFRNRLMQLGFRVIGDKDSPVVPVMVYHPAALAEFSRLCLKLGIAVVVVGYPATTLLGSRVRFCISASHTVEGLEKAVQDLDKIGELLLMKYDRPKPNVKIY